MEPNGVDDVIAGRRLPFSRAFSQAGFTQPEAERWRLAGWTDPVLASEWRHLERWCTPEQLHALAQKGLGADQVERVARSAPRVIEAWTRTLGTLEIPVSDIEIDLRERVLANLHRDGLTCPRDVSRSGDEVAVSDR